MSPQAATVSSKQPFHLVFVCGRERELSCFLPAAGPCKGARADWSLFPGLHCGHRDQTASLLLQTCPEGNSQDKWVQNTYLFRLDAFLRF